ncbi:hypothetical protein [Streptomyces sp. Isolate_219]|uniref:hypothetical protein n=1 Tax=Streptomyces sp. Isolate_219 TaxID=2950110 RepID=UPI0021CA404D|nr:hypothetical protein [Streptomyces sp. Isolate_219]MCR8576084.1 hypothetical protein [Streptomyces sp. Isolate_219]
MNIDLERVAAIQRSVIGGVLLTGIAMSIYRFLAWVARRVRPLQARWLAWNARVAERDMEPTTEALQRLGLAGLPIQSFREAGQKTAGAVKLRYRLLTFAVGLGTGDLMMAVIKTIETQRVQPSLQPSALTLAAVTLPLLMWAARRGKAVAGYRLLLSIMSAIEACGAVATSSASDRHQALRHLDDTCSTLRRSLLRVHRIANSVTRRSPRQRKAKHHAALVVAKLQLAEAQVDSKGDAGLRSLAALLAKIGNNFAAGRASTLLPEQSLRDTAPVANREGLRLTVVVVVTAGALCLGVLLELPAGVDVVLSGSAAVLAAMVIYGPRSAIAKAGEIMGILRP